ASGAGLTLQQADIRRRGHALEFRIYAEDPVRFLPSPGPLNVFRPPEGEGIRVDAGYAEGGIVTPYYDPLLAKLIVSGKDRAEAIRRSDDALQRFDIQGLKNTVPLHLRLVRDRAFQEGVLDTHFLEHHAKP